MAVTTLHKKRPTTRERALAEEWHGVGGKTIWQETSIG